ncbi:deoxyribodipyrimidine photo-lyase [Nitrosopumilus adriaticus]|uniref:cryptochrome/photolyase family protein n=1 Tax=Nitrosopumilus adriaticus TaxID=1580092 RepID=UPI00352FCDA3
MYEKSLFIFRRDLRLNDNTGLIKSLANSKNVIPCFIYDDNLLKNSTISEFRWNFLNESLFDLDLELKKKKSTLHQFRGDSSLIVDEIIQKFNVDAIFTNTDFSEYSKSRDSKINEICKKNKIDFHLSLDYLLHNPYDIKTNDEKPYMIYSHFYKKARQLAVRLPSKNSKNNYSNAKISKVKIKMPEIKNPIIPGGRNEGLKILKNLEKFIDYDKFRDFPSLCHTTTLSAHNKFGTLSIREIYHAIEQKLGLDHVLMGEIYWREFFNHILFNFPWSQTKSFRKKFQKIKWTKSKENFSAWCDGETGFPIVDAGMRQLNQTGFMHNRVRMIVASFLTKDLHIDWRLGERYFAKKLVDYDPAVNVGNWQWAASTGCDSVPYFRIFNPWLQQEKFDCDCLYIKKWVTELNKLSPKIIHNLWKCFPEDLNYVRPIVNHKIESEKTKLIFKSQK